MKTPWQIAHPEQHLRVARESMARLHTERKEKIFTLLGNKCAHCGFSDRRALQIDHVNGGGKKDRGLNTLTYLKKVIESIENGEKKYQLLCANCNWIKRHECREAPQRKETYV